MACTRHRFLSFGVACRLFLLVGNGIVVNDAIVLIDRINKNLKRGMQYTDGIVEAGLARMQPILLTTATTIAGIIPLTFADAMWRSLGISIIFGLLFGTGLTLVIIPALYYSVCKKDYKKNQVK